MDTRFELQNGDGSDAVHTTPVYAYAVCILHTARCMQGVVIAFSLGTINKLVCDAID